MTTPTEQPDALDQVASDQSATGTDAPATEAPTPFHDLGRLRRPAAAWAA